MVSWYVLAYKKLTRQDEVKVEGQSVIWFDFFWHSICVEHPLECRYCCFLARGPHEFNHWVSGILTVEYEGEVTTRHWSAKLRHRMVEIAHECHQGQVWTKQLLREYVWFHGMDSQCDKFVSTCIACQSNTPQMHRKPLRMTDLPEGPWEKVSVDFCGPMASGDLALVFYCQYARYPPL